MYKEYLSRAAATLKLAAIDQALGHPTRGTHVGNGPHVSLSTAYTPGAPGWTATECVIEDANDGSGRALLTLTDRALLVPPTDLTLPEKPDRYRGPR